MHLNLKLALFGSVVIGLLGSSSAQTFETIYSFLGGSDGSFPQSALVADSAGNLYGTTTNGGENGQGTVFQLAPPTTPGGPWQKTILHNFTGNWDGGNTGNDLAIDGEGNVYGTTPYGGQNNAGAGTVFELKAPSTPGGAWNFQVIADFSQDHCLDEGPCPGYSPLGGVAPDASGNLYGATQQGGIYNQGTIYELSPDGNGWKLSFLYQFKGGPDGCNPANSLVLDAAGNIYGAASCGAYNRGAVFELSPPSPGGTLWLERVLYSPGAHAENGFYPSGKPVVLDSNGGLIVDAAAGGEFFWGNVFTLTAKGSTWSQNVLYAFTGGADGGQPWDGLVRDSATGTLYGATLNKGLCESCGVLYKLTQDSPGVWSQTVLYSFGNGGDGSAPAGGIIFGPDGALYGSTSAGGLGCNESGCGTVFRLTP
jgi:uncharacterized repeat protein (TIGR03803 family)